MIYNNLYLQLPWEPAKYMILTQSNKDTPTHLPGSYDEYALDFGLTSGTPVIAAVPGVAYVYNENDTNASDYGNHIKVDHGYFYTLYAHLSSFAEGIFNGAEIRKGELIGYAGATGGNWNAHLHFGLFHGYAWEDGYRHSVESKLVVANEGEGPYRVLQSTEFKDWESYLSGNFRTGEEGIIICNTNNECYIDSSGGVGGYDTGDEGTSTGPDGNIKKVEISFAGKEEWCHSLSYYPGRLIDIKVKLTNKGDVRINNARVKYYRSNNNTFNPAADTLLGEDENIDIEPGDSYTEHLRNVSIPELGSYYIFSKIITEGDNNSTNDLSRNDDQEEYGKVIVVQQRVSSPPGSRNRKWLIPAIQNLLTHH